MSCTHEKLTSRQGLNSLLKNKDTNGMNSIFHIQSNFFPGISYESPYNRNAQYTKIKKEYNAKNYKFQICVMCILTQLYFIRGYELHHMTVLILVMLDTKKLDTFNKPNKRKFPKYAFLVIFEPLIP